MDKPRPIKRALLSVSDKTGIVDFARSLADKGVDILSTGGTAKLLSENRVLHVGKYYAPFKGGIENFTRDLIECDVYNKRIKITALL